MTSAQGAFSVVFGKYSHIDFKRTLCKCSQVFLTSRYLATRMFLTKGIPEGDARFVARLWRAIVVSIAAARRCVMSCERGSGNLDLDIKLSNRAQSRVTRP